MSIQRDVSFDLSDPRICAFLQDYGSKTYEGDQDCISARQSDGYDYVDRRTIHAQKQILLTYRSTGCDLFTPVGRFIRRVQVIEPVEHRLNLEVVAVLFIRTGISREVSERLRNAFATTDPAHNSIEDIETEIIRSGVRTDDYQVDLSFHLIKVADPIIIDTNLRALLKQVEQYRDPSGAAYFQIRLDERAEYLCTAPSADTSETLVVKDVENPLREIAELENERHRECDGLDFTWTRIGTVFQYYEWKVEWLIRPVRIGRCTIMVTRIPVIFSRITKKALYGYVMSRPDLKRNMERGILSCLILAAVNTGILASVISGIGWAAAAVAFAASTVLCIESKVSDGVDCLYANLRLVEETSEWQEKVF